METKWVKIDAVADVACVYEKELALAAELLAAGELVAFPTETVYGLGGNALLAISAEKIYRAKGRPSDNPLIVHVAEVDQVSEIAVPDSRAKTLMRALCPAPLTCVLPKKDCIPAAVTGGLSTVAVRIPNHPVALALLRRCRLPVAAPSANLSGHPSPTTGRHVYEDLAGRIAMVLDSGSCGVGVESTVLDLTVDPPVILRPGAVTAAMLEPYLGRVLLGGEKVGDGEAPKAPGMKYRHYAPRGEVTLFSGDALVRAYERAADPDIAVLATDAVLARLKVPRGFSLGRDEEDLATAAHRLFAALRYCDRVGATKIFAQTFPEKGLGIALMNRLKKAAAKK